MALKEKALRRLALETSGSAVVLGTNIPLLTESAWDAVAQLLQ